MASAASPDFIGPDREDTRRLPELLDRFSAPSDGLPPLPEGFWRDRFGVLTRCAFRRGWEGRSQQQVDEIDLAVELEWFALLRAVEEAGETFRMVELGAGYGPWLLRAAVIRRRTAASGTLDLVAVEGEPTHVGFLRQHAADNGLPKDCLSVFEGAVAAKSGTARFELANDPAGDWGTRISDAEADPDLPRVPNPQIIEMPAHSLAELVGERPLVDLLHVDIQGSERDVLLSAEDLLAQRVRRMLIGTHGRAIEGALLKRLPELGFLLMAEQPCRYRLGGGRPVVVADGAQYWVNGAL